MDPKHSHGPDRVDYQETPGDLTEAHLAARREHPEPTAAATPVPMWLIVTCGVAVCWAGLYLGFFNGGLKGDVFNELNTNASLLFPAPGKAGPAKAMVEPTLAEQGKAVYGTTCNTCHMGNGAGQPGVIPPLIQSPYVGGSEKRMAAIILKGLKGPITVKGATFNGTMPAWEGTLNNKKLAAVASFVRSSFGNNAPPITEAQFAAARKELEAHKDQMTDPEILQIPEDATLPGGEAAGGAPAPSPAGGPPAPVPGSTALTPKAGATTTPPSPPVQTGAPAQTVPPGSANPATPSIPAVPGSPANPTSPPSTPATPGTSASPATPPPAPAGAASTGPAASPEQLESGKKVYMTICIACHQATGLGLAPLFPPLTKSPYVNGSAERLTAMILKGNLPPMTVDGKVYALSPMPPQEAALTDDKVADVATFVRANFGNSAPPVTTAQVAATRAKFADRKTSWTQAELDAWKE